MEVAHGARARRGLGSLAVFALALAFHLWLELREPGLFEVDGYYHVKLASLYGTGEFPLTSGEFPWMAWTSFGKRFADWQLGYHLVLVPFTWIGLVLGAKVSVAVLAALLAATVHAILRAERVPLAWLLALLAGVLSDLYLLRSHLVRPTTLVVTLLLVVAWCAARRRYRALFLATFALLVVYAVPHNALAVLVVACVAVLASERHLSWKLPAVVLGAITAAILVHPGFWRWEGSFFGRNHALFGVWEQMDGSLAAAKAGNRVLVDGRKIALQAPAEFHAPARAEIERSFTAPLALLALALLLALLPGRAPRDPFLLTALGLALLYFGLFLQHIRFFEYWIPFTVLALGAALRRWLGDEPARGLREWWTGPRWRVAGGVLLAGGALALVGRETHAAVGRTLELVDSGATGGGLDYEGAAAWLAANSEPGELVFHDRWPAFAPLFFFDHRNRYVVGLDPYFFFQEDPQAYQRWLAASNGSLSPLETRAVVLDLGARLAFTRRRSDFAAQLTAAPGVELAYEDRRFVVLRVRDDG
jgi:hypothetical protein